jgi:hypothetical protein
LGVCVGFRVCVDVGVCVGFGVCVGVEVCVGAGVCVCVGVWLAGPQAVRKRHSSTIARSKIGSSFLFIIDSLQS